MRTARHGRFSKGPCLRAFAALIGLATFVRGVANTPGTLTRRFLYRRIWTACSFISGSRRIGARLRELIDYFASYLDVYRPKLSKGTE
jgi:hypothetical protein